MGDVSRDGTSIRLKWNLEKLEVATGNPRFMKKEHAA